MRTRPTSRLLRTCLGFCLLFGLLGQAAAQPKPIGVRAPEGEGTVAYDINASGQVAAVLENPDGTQRGVMFEKGKLIEVGSLGGHHSYVRAINDKGQLIGSASDKEGRWSAFLFDKENGMRKLGTLGGSSSHGLALNQRGDAVGYADTDDDQWHAFLYDGSAKLIDLGTLGGKISYASSVNNKGQVVGTASLGNEYRHAFMYDKEQGMVDLGTLGGRQSSASAINDSGVIVGASETSERRWHAFIYDGKTMVDIGAKIGYGNSYATDINNKGHVVGTVQIGPERASFVWRDNKLTIHRGGWGLRLVNKINDRGQVIGAEGQQKFNAATMMSGSRAVKAHGEADFIFLVILILMLVATVIVLRNSYRGMSIRSLAG